MKNVKGCFLLQRNFAPVGHAIAYALKNKYNVTESCAYTSLRENYDFLHNQTDVKYTSIVLDEDIYALHKNEALDLKYLEWLEKEYGIPNLWPFLTIDRILLHGQFLRMYPFDQPLLGHEDLLRILQATAKKIITFFETEKPDFVFLPAVGSLGPFILFEVARKKGIPIFLGEYSRFKNHFMIMENTREYLSLRERFLKIKNKEVVPEPQIIEKAKTLLRPTLYDETITPDQQPINRREQMKFLLFPVNLYQSIRNFIKITSHYYIGKTKDDYMQTNPWFYLIDRLKKKGRVLIGYNDLYDEIDDKDNFAYFALSYEPELSLLFYSPFATDQIYIIKQLSQALPVNYKLYVKEHPQMFGHRTRKFYKEIKKMPNVKLINPGAKSFDLIKKAKLVATINGTVGWEAILFKKPVITFGQAFYNALSMVKYCTRMPDLAAMVKQQTENFNYDEQELLDFIVALLEDTVPVDMLKLWEHRNQPMDIEKMAQEVEPLVDLLAKKLNLEAVKN